MRITHCEFELLTLVLLAIIPWPGPTVFKISCPRESAAIVRKVVLKKWTPVLDRFHLSLPLECPFHPQRDMFYPQQKAKRQHRLSLWTCGFCGKSFFEEKFLDIHFDNRHKGEINMAEDAVCLADYCDIMRCEVLASQAMSSQFLNEETHLRTDLEIWREGTEYRTALAPVGPRDLARISSQPRPKSSRSSAATPLCTKESVTEKEDNGESKSSNGDGDGNTTSCDKGGKCDDSHLVDSAVPPNDKKQQRISEMQKLKANCKPEQLNLLRESCEMLVQDCIAGLLVSLSDDDYKEVEEELNRAVCWYLTCDRYWEDTIGDSRPFPWGLVFVLVMLLSLGLCLVYYVIWVLFDSEDVRGSGVGVDPANPYGPGDPVPQSGPTPNDQYIYVSYPHDLKRRLVESCYDRTSRV